MGFYESDDPTNSVKALKEAVVLRIGFDPTRSTSPCYNTTQYTWGTSELVTRWIRHMWRVHFSLTRHMWLVHRYIQL